MKDNMKDCKVYGTEELELTEKAQEGYYQLSQLSQLKIVEYRTDNGMAYAISGVVDRTGMTADEVNQFLEAFAPKYYELKIRYKDGEIDDYYTRLNGEGWQAGEAQNADEALQEMKDYDPETFEAMDENVVEYWAEEI